VAGVVQHALVRQLLDQLALGKGFGQGDEWPLHQRDVERRGTLQQLPGLLSQFRVRERECREEVAQELVADAMSKMDRVDWHRTLQLLSHSNARPSRIRNDPCPLFVGQLIHWRFCHLEGEAELDLLGSG
jgi:hypothetical protein